MSQTKSSLFRTALIQCEKLARITEQLLFLKRCRDTDTLPPTIENIRFPSFMKEKSMRNTVMRMKRTILQKMIKFVYRQLYNTKNACLDAIRVIFKINAESNAYSLSAACERAYQRSRTHQHKRLQNKFDSIGKRNMHKTTQPGTEVCSTLVTDLSGSLNSEEIKLLAKGPKFAITKKWTTELKTDVQANFCKVAYQLRWRSQVEQRSQDRISRYPESNVLHLPSRTDQDLEHKLKQSYAELKKLMDKIDKSKQHRNISKAETKILHDLRQKDLVFLPSDRGGEFCVISSNEYQQAALKHLDDETIYKKVTRMTAKTIETKINGAWRKVSSTEGIKSHISRSYVSNNTDLPRFYHLVKTHKEGPDIKIRPIVSNVNGPTKKISWLLCKLLNPLYKLLPTHLDNSAQLINHIRDVDPSVRSTHVAQFHVQHYITKLETLQDYDYPFEIIK